MKEFGAAISEEFKAHKESFNEFYFERCICAAIIFRTIDDYLERNKDSAKKPTGFWYKTGGYKLNIVPYTIAKILSSIPNGYTLNWKDIWDKQRLSPAFIREIEIVTRMTNDFICDSHGVIVTEYCKRQSTWEEYRDKVKYELSGDFLAELIPESMLKEAEKDAKRDQKETNDLQTIMDMIAKGAGYWNSMLMKGSSSLSYQEKNAVMQIINIATTGNIPSSKSGKLPIRIMTAVKLALAAEEKLISEGISV
mgnify:FL=1